MAQAYICGAMVLSMRGSSGTVKWREREDGFRIMVTSTRDSTATISSTATEFTNGPTVKLLKANSKMAKK